jgi:hypothetical protein
MVGSLEGTDGYFRRDGYGGTESHFGVGGLGTVYQWQDTAYRAEANGTANPRAISIETADMGKPFPSWNTNDGNAVPAWTDDQCEAIAAILAWASTVHAIPLVPVTSSATSARGIGYHRLGVPGSRGATRSVTGGELWSSAAGKVCPGARRIAQIPAIIRAAQQTRDGGSAPAAVAPPRRRRRDSVLQTYELSPGQGATRKIFPTGQGVIVTERAWLSFAANGPSQGRVRVFFQGAAGQGLSDTGQTPLDVRFGNGASQIRSVEIPSGTAQVVVQWDMPEGGTMTYEGLARA